jgi:hypothetical protein
MALRPAGCVLIKLRDAVQYCLAKGMADELQGERQAAFAKARRPNPRSPGSRAKSFRTCQGLRPRRAGPLAITPPSMLPSAFMSTSAPGTILFSQLNGWPMRSPADASPTPSRMPAHGSGPMRIAIAVDLDHLLFAGFDRRTIIQEFSTPEMKAAFLIPLASQLAHSSPSSRRAVFS